MVKIEEQVEKAIEKMLAREGIEIVDIEYLPGPAARLVIYIDQEGGVDIDTCARVSEMISPVLDVYDFIPGRYYLEVSSPGIERRIKKPRDFRRFVGQKVKLETTEALEGRRRFTGQIAAAGEESFTLETEQGRVEVPYGLIKKANLVVDIEF